MNRSRGAIALEKLERRLGTISGYQAKLTWIVLVVVGGWYVGLLLYFKGDTAKANYVFTNSFQFLAVAWCCWFMLPYFLRVEAKQDVSLAMGHDSVDMLDKIDTAIEGRMEKLDAILAKADKLVSQVEAGDHPTVKRVVDALEGIRTRIERDTAPLPAIRRPQSEGVEAHSRGNGGV